MASFVIVRNGKWKFCTLIFSLMIASMVIPFQVLMVPLVSVYGGTLGVLNHRLTLILMHVGFSVSMAMFMFHGAIRTNIPLELEDAARIDGCGHGRTYLRIMLPLIKPGLVSLGVLTLRFAWNNLMWPMIVNTEKAKMTLSAGLSYLQGQYITDYPSIMAGAMLATIPLVIIYAIFQRQFIEGIALTGIK